MPVMPDVKIRVLGLDPDPWAILKRAVAAMQDAGKSDEEITAFTGACLREGAEDMASFLRELGNWVVIESPLV